MENSIQKFEFDLIQFNKIFIQLENQGIEHHYITPYNIHVAPRLGCQIQILCSSSSLFFISSKNYCIWSTYYYLVKFSISILQTFLEQFFLLISTYLSKLSQVNFSAFHSMYDVETPLCSARSSITLIIS